MALIDQLRALGLAATSTTTPAPKPTPEPESSEPFATIAGEPVRDSPDLRRILTLPRRQLDVSDSTAAEKWTRILAAPPVACDCVTRWGYCITKLNPIQGHALEEANQVGGLTGVIGVGFGKALALDTPIPTPEGWTTMGALQVGDIVLDSRGHMCTVTFATEVQYGRECFAVELSDGSAIIADADHRWVTRNYSERRSLDRGTKKVHEPKVRTTREIKDSIFHRHNKNHAIDVAGTLDLPPVTFPLDPYVLGAWLGDGTSASGDITSMDPEILAAFDAHFSRGSSYPSGKAITQTFLKLSTQLKLLGVLNNKHVPKQYLRASKAQRLALLQGLMDTDGTAGVNNHVEFCSTSEILAQNVFELAASLGQIPKLYLGRATLYGKDCGTKYRVCWQPTIPVFRLERKLSRLRLGRYKQSQVKSRRYINAVSPVSSVPVRCITVDSPDHTYLCGKAMIPTHNTGLDILLPMVVAGTRVAVLVLPAKLRHQFLEQDYPQWSVHFRVPNLAGGSKFYTDGRPVLHVLSYEGLGQIKNSDILTRLRPDLIIADEAHKFKNPRAACTTRLEREMTPAMKFIPLSGTMTSRSPLDCGHLFGHSLKQGSPLPLHKPTLEDWAGAVAASDFCRPAGALMALAKPGEDVQEAFRRRLIETPGVIATETSAVSTSLSITALSVEVPEEVEALIRQAKKGVRPDGEEAIDVMTAAGWARQLSAGFYHRWIYPRGEPEDLIAKWFTIRKAFNKEIREKLKHRPEFMDSPGSLFRAAHRWHSGYKHQGVEYAPKTVKGPLPTWNSIYWPEWLAIRHQVEPQTDVVWVDDFLLAACEKWGRANKGIIWTEHAEFGAVLAARLNTTWYHGEGMNPESEKGDRTIVCSIKANSDGLNLQHSFYKNLFASVPSSGLLWEQAIGRTHRPLQKADEVEVEVFLHTAALSNAFAQARLDARYQQGLTGPKKLCYANMDLKNAVE